MSMNRKIYTYFFVLSFIFFSAASLMPQEQSAVDVDQPAAENVQPADNTSKSTSSQTSTKTEDVFQNQVKGKETAEPKKPSPAPSTVKNNVPKEEQPVAEKPSVKQTATGVTGLLELNDDELKFMRIPGLVSVKNVEPPAVIETAEGDAVKTAEADDEADENNDGILGMSKETSDVVTRIALVMLVVIIFVLYRLRSRGGSRKVLRSYPKR